MGVGGAGPSQLRLLARPGAQYGATSVDGTVRRVMQGVHAVTKDPRLVLHHLRHSCATWLWLKLRAPDYPSITSYLSTMPALRRELRQAKRLRIQLCGASPGPSRAYSNVVSRILGHGMPVTSLEHYIHVADLFLPAIALQKASGTPAAVWQALADASRSTVYEWLERGPHGVVQGFRARHGRSGDTPAAGLYESSATSSPWRKPAARTPVRFSGDGAVGTVSRVLQLYNRIDEDGPHASRVASIARACSRSEATIDRWVEAARSLGSAFGMEAPAAAVGGSLSKVPAPDVNLHLATVAALDDLAERIEGMARDHLELLEEALQIASSRFNLRRHDVCFVGEKDEIAARRFLKALDMAGLVPGRVRLTVRRVDPRDTKLPHWFRSTRVRDVVVKRLPPPSNMPNQARAYARWVGVQLCGPDGAPAGHAWRIGLFLACVAYLSPLDPSSSGGTPAVAALGR